MSSNLRVNNILPSVGTNVAIGTAGGSITLTGSVTGSSITNTGVTTVSAGSTSAPSISPSGDSNTGIFFPSADTIAFAEGGVEAARIDSSGRFGINVTSPTAKFQINSQDGLLADVSSVYSYVRLGSASTGESTSEFGYDRSTGANIFKQGTTGSTLNERFRIDSSGNLGINSTSPGRKLDVVDSGVSGSVVRSRVTTNNGGYLAYEALNSSGTSVFSVTHNGRINLSENIVFASGQGLDFSATANSSGTMTSELLSDYEEGTWTPSITGHTLNASSSGKYTKIGRTVHFWAQITFGGSGAATATVNGLPFTVTGDGWGGYVAIQDTGFTTPIHTFSHGGTVQIYIRNTSNTDYNTNVFYNKFLYIQGAYNV